jgi:hypothetical protein
MQLMRGTYNEMREQEDLGPNPYNVRDNILAGTAYLRVPISAMAIPFSLLLIMPDLAGWRII